MKKILYIAVAALTVLSSCQKDPSVSVTPQTATVSTKGGTVSFTVSADGEWKTATAADITVSPSSGSGNSPVSITVPENTSGLDRNVEVTFYCVQGSSTQVVTITQVFYEDPISVKLSEVPDTVDFAAGDYTIKLETNYAWEVSAMTDGITFDPDHGNAGASSIKVSVPAYTGTATEYRDLDFAISINSITEHRTEVLEFKQMAPNLLYGGVTYKLVKLKDGNIWMAENLRYIPEGKTVSDDLTALDNGLWYPVKVNSAGNGGEFDKSEAGIAAKGYLYTTATAFGVSRGSITEENGPSFEGCQGICPDGWHIPTVTEEVNLVGKCNNGTLTKTDAPYYDPDLGTGSGSIALLESDKWPVQSAVAGMMQVNKDTDATAAFGGLIGTPKTLNTGYFAGSSFYKKTNSNLQFYGLMPSVKNGNISAGFNNITNGVSVRCVMDKKKNE